MRNFFLIMSTLFLLAGCSGHKTTMQDVRSYCRSVTTDVICDSQDSICAEYSEVTLRPYASAKECRQSCEKVRMDSQRFETMQSCIGVFQAVEGKCTEFCNVNYE